MASISYFSDSRNNVFFSSNENYDYISINDQFDDNEVFYSDSENNDLLNKSLFSLISSFVPLKSNIDCPTGILPPGVRHIGSNYVVYEKPPTYHNIFYIPSTVQDMVEYTYDEDGEIEDSIDVDLETDVYRVPIPWQLYIATFSEDYICTGVYMYFMNTSLFSSDQNLYMPTLPNFYTNGFLCRPMFSSMDEILSYDKNIKGVIESSYNWIWGGGTNNDLNENILHLFVQCENNPIVSNIPPQLRKLFPSFNSINGPHYASPSSIQAFLLTWQNLTIDDILDCSWPNPSTNKHFQTFHNIHGYPEDFLDRLPEYISECYYDENEEYPSDDYIEEIISCEDYSFSSYRDWMISSGYYTPAPPSYPWSSSMTYKQILSLIIEELRSMRAEAAPSLNLDIVKIKHTLRSS